jgi:uncharacterized protein YndB with AHSA1/START domain
MPGIFHDFPIAVPPAAVFQAVSTPQGLDRWWTKESSGEPRPGAEYQLGFGPPYDWRARVRRYAPPKLFELELVRASDDWLGTRVGFRLTAGGGGKGTQVRFSHLGWPVDNEHYRVSCYCWAMYLRILKRYLEHGESVPYENRLEV